jgi:hypothetical protein
MSKVDILIATPGRLMDHLTSTPNFTLQHLRFLVIDEADRLLGQSFQNWLPEVLTHTRAPTVATKAEAIVAGDAVADAWLDASGVSSLDWEGSERDSVDSNVRCACSTTSTNGAAVSKVIVLGHFDKRS